ncbi:MAG: signal recognition particle-docking protein FtsY [Armatimonadetes bacterium]|nr:signal recognition particle-docking protein FtsY [Armatimonadota bacterium]
MLKWFRKIDQMLTGRGTIDEETYEELEDMLIQADVGVNTTMKLMTRLRETVSERRLELGEDVSDVLKEIMIEMLSTGDHALRSSPTPPTVVMMVGVNGTGKTTTLGKLAHRYQSEGKRVVVAAGDTFRAAAIEQLEIWAQRTGSHIIKHQAGSDPAAVIYDSLQAAKARGADVLLADTAGRQHTKSNLMDELNKIGRIVERERGRPADEVLLVLDSTTGQNLVQQAKEFSRIIPVTGVVLTKIDSTAKGGAALTLVEELKIPIKLLGTGEKMDQLRPFDALWFVDQLFE